MLPEPLRLLVSAYALGDLSPRRRSAAVRLLRHSAEARQLLKELKSNRRRLRAMTPPALPADFSDRVVQSLPAGPPIIGPSVMVATRGSGSSRTARYAAAATILIAVAAGAYLAGSLPRDRSDPARTVSSRKLPSPQLHRTPTVGSDQLAESIGPPANVPETDSSIAKGPPKPANPGSTAPIPDPLGTLVPPPPKLTSVAAPRLLILSVRDLEGAEGRKRFQKELAKSGQEHIDLFCRDVSKGLERVQGALRGRGLRLIVDVQAQESLKRKLRAQYLVYCDDLTAVEWAQILQGLSAGDRKENLFDQVVMFPFDGTDQKDLTSVLGADPTQPETRRSRAGGPAKNDRQALVATLTPWRTSPGSKDVKQFADTHSEREAGDIAVVLVLRMPGS
jgi:hypothetical protein